MIGLCADSNSQLSPELLDRFGATVVPLTVELDGHDYLEGVDLDADAFYQRFHDGVRPTFTITEPSPGQFALAYEELAQRGCTEILSVHSGAAPLAGVLSAARLAAHRAEVNVRLVETGLPGFATGCCVWAAADAVARGASLDDAVLAADRAASLVGHVFTVASIELLAAGGKGAGESPVLTTRDGRLEAIGSADSATSAVEVMAAVVLAADRPVNVAIGTADRAGLALAEALALRLGPDPCVHELVRFRIGPSVGAQSGPGTTALYFFPVDESFAG